MSATPGSPVNCKHHLVGDLVGEPARLRGRQLELLGGDQPELGRGEVVEPHLHLGAVAAEREQAVQPAWAPAAAKLAQAALSAAGLSAGIAGVPATTLKTAEKLRSLPVTSGTRLTSPWGSLPPTSVKSG